MKRLTSENVLALPFGAKIKIVYHNSKYHEKNATYKAVVYGNKIGYEDGTLDHLRIIAEEVASHTCMVYLI